MITWAQLVSAALLTGSPVVQYVADAGTYVTIQAASINNQSGGVATVNIYILASGGSAGDGTLVCSRNVADGAVVNLYEIVNFKLAPAGAIYADGDGCYLNIAGSINIPS